MKTNNFDQSSTGINLELACFRDSDQSRIEFEENFTCIQPEEYRRSGCWFYSEYGNNEKPDNLSDCYDFGKCNRKDFRQYALEYYELSENSEPGLIRELIDDMFEYGSWKDLAIHLLDDEVGFYDAMRNEFPDIHNAVLKYESCNVTGYSQGDYALVLYPIGSKFEGMREHFKHLFYDAPIYCRLTVNDEEFDLMEDTEDYYKWDREAVIKAAPEVARGWLKNKLPEYPEYCD